MKTCNKIVHQADSGKEYKGMVVAYMRYSSEKQDDKSIGYQRNAIRTYCSNENLFLCAEYWDEALTATNDSRPSFQQLIADARASPSWNKILVFDYNRFVRETHDAEVYIGLLRKLNIDVYSITEKHDTSNEGLLMRDFKHALNAFTSRNIGKFTREGMLINANNGEHCGGKPPLGYDLVDKKLVINEYEAKIVKTIFDMYENNFSYNKMAERLNKQGYRTRDGKLFTRNSFASVLHQEKYTGTFVWNKTSGKQKTFKKNFEAEHIRVENKVPAIITRQQFDKVQQMFANRINGSASSKNRNFYLLSGGGFLKCAECGALMVGAVVNSNRARYKYYRCPNHKKGSLSCSNTGIRADLLDDFVAQILVADIKRREDLVYLYNTSDEKDKVRILESKIKSLEKAIKKLIAEISSRENDDSLAEMRAVLNDIATKKMAFKVELEQILSTLEIITEADRKMLCDQIFDMIRTSDSLEVKKYLKETIFEIKVSSTDVEIALDIA